MENNVATIKVKKTTKERLDKYLRAKESYDDLLVRILDSLDTKSEDITY